MPTVVWSTPAARATNAGDSHRRSITGLRSPEDAEGVNRLTMRRATYSGSQAWLPAHDARAARLLLAAEGRGGGGGGASGPAVDLDTLGEATPLRPDECVPAGRQPFNIAADRVHAVTLLSRAALRVLSRSGSVAPRAVDLPFNTDLPGFAAAYDWMRWQMVRDVPGYGGGFPIWLWVRISRRDLVGNLRAGRRAAGGGSSLVTASVPRDRLLMTDYMAWHDVLNGLPSLPMTCPVCGRQYCEAPTCLDRWYDPWSDTWQARAPKNDRGDSIPWWNWPVPLREELLASWAAVKEVRPRRPVQACVERLDARWVTSVRSLA